MKYGANGAVLWTNRYNAANSSDDSLANLLVIDAASSVYVAGSAQTPLGPAYAMVKLDSSGTQLWAQTYVGPGDNFGHETHGMAIDGVGNILVTGQANADYVTLKYIQNAPPILKLLLLGANQVLSWPAAASNSVVESATNLSPPVQLTAIGSTLLSTNLTNSSSAPRQFFRLRSL